VADLTAPGSDQSAISIPLALTRVSVVAHSPVLLPTSDGHSSLSRDPGLPIVPPVSAVR
jgi:hypothetical protein